MNNLILERYAMNKLKKFCTDAARDGLSISTDEMPFDTVKKLDIDTTALIVSIIECFIDDYEEAVEEDGRTQDVL